MAGNPFLPGGSYGWPGGGAYETPFVRDYLSPDVPRGEYETYLTNNNLGGLTRRDDAARGMYDRTQSGYQAAVLQNPMLTYRDYLNTHLGADFFQNALAGMTPNQLGDRPNMWTGRARTVARA